MDENYWSDDNEFYEEEEEPIQIWCHNCDCVIPDEGETICECCKRIEKGPMDVNDPYWYDELKYKQLCPPCSPEDWDYDYYVNGWSDPEPFYLSTEGEGDDVIGMVYLRKGDEVKPEPKPLIKSWVELFDERS